MSIFCRFDIHDWSKWVVFLSPVTLQEASRQRECKSCGKIEKQKAVMAWKWVDNNDDGGGA